MIFRPDLFIPELFQIGIIATLFVLAVGKPSWSRNLIWLPWVAVVGVIVSVFSLGAEGTIFYGAYSVDALSQFFKLVIAIGFAMAVYNAVSPSHVDEEKRADYFLFLATSAFGLMLLCSGVELITIYLALEISSYSLYALIPLRNRDKQQAAEAGIKYILFGAVVTAVAMYGLSFIMAAYHTTYIFELAHVSWSLDHYPMAVLGLTLFLCALFYKLALFPFHFWCPDVYQGASNETAAFVATLPKLGAVVVLIRFATLLEPGMHVTTILAVLAAASMTFGNLVALVQKDLKRLLAYSSVAHAGYVLLGIVAGTPEGLAAASFYSLVYLLMNLTCFWVICRMSTDGRNLVLDDLNGLYTRSPILAFILAVCAFALVGLPPTAGFMGKLFLLNSAWAQGYEWLVVVAVVNTAIAIYYYLNMVRHAYTMEPREEPLHISGPTMVWGGIFAASILLLGTVPGPVFRFAQTAGQFFMP